jgi:hypothetical protein
MEQKKRTQLQGSRLDQMRIYSSSIFSEKTWHRFQHHYQQKQQKRNFAVGHPQKIQSQPELSENSGWWIAYSVLLGIGFIVGISLLYGELYFLHFISSFFSPLKLIKILFLEKGLNTINEQLKGNDEQIQNAMNVLKVLSAINGILF